MKPLGTLDVNLEKAVMPFLSLSFVSWENILISPSCSNLFDIFMTMF